MMLKSVAVILPVSGGGMEVSQHLDETAEGSFATQDCCTKQPKDPRLNERLAVLTRTGDNLKEGGILGSDNCTAAGSGIGSCFPNIRKDQLARGTSVGAPPYRRPPLVQKERHCLPRFAGNQWEFAIHACVHRRLNEGNFTNKRVGCRSSTAKKVWAVTFQIGIHSGDVLDSDFKPEGSTQQTLHVLATDG